MNRPIPSPEMRAFARRLLVYEATVDALSEANGAAAFRVSEKLRRPLSTLAGTTGFYSLLSRALTLAKREAHILSAVHVNPDGSLQGLRELPGDEAAEAGILLITQLLGLLVTFIGESLTLRLVQDAWPDLPSGDTDSGEVKST